MIEGVKKESAVARNVRWSQRDENGKSLSINLTGLVGSFSGMKNSWPQIRKSVRVVLFKARTFGTSLDAEMEILIKYIVARSIKYASTGIIM